VRPGPRRGRPGPPGPRASRRDGRPVDGNEGRAPFLPSDPREAALRILQAVDTRHAFSDRLLEGAHAAGPRDERDRALMHELVKGSLRWRARLDWALDARVHVGLGKLNPWIRNVLRLGAYQILFLDRVPAHAAVDESVKLAHRYGHPGAAGLVNSVLRRLADEKDTVDWPRGDAAPEMAVWGSHPQWLVERWLERFGPEETRALLEADNRPAPLSLRANRLRGTREALIERLAQQGVTAVASALAPDVVRIEGGESGPLALAAFREGLCTAQDESEALVARLVAPEPHDRVLDLCAAPGGKCTHLAELMGDEGDVWALERSPARVAALEATLARLGCVSIHVVTGDARNHSFPMPFDRVLVDAPCSGLGVLRRRADARWRKGPALLAEMPGIQRELLEAGARQVRKGGVLVYSVCSFEPEETWEVVERFLSHHPSFAAQDAAAWLPAPAVERGALLTLPHRHGCDGAFALRMRRS
jgi:16S rRNA (cytosine967-C5)-methyltransferase